MHRSITKVLRVAGLVGAVAVLVAGCISGSADARKAAQWKSSTQSQPEEKPVKLRYYGGPKSPMYPG